MYIRKGVLGRFPVVRSDMSDKSVFKWNGRVLSNGSCQNSSAHEQSWLVLLLHLSKARESVVMAGKMYTFAFDFFIKLARTS